MINWQGYRWPVSPDRTAGSSVDPSRSSISEVIGWHITSFKWPQAQVFFFPMIHMKYVVFLLLWPRTVKILISNWPRMPKFRHFIIIIFLIQAGKTFSYYGHALRPIFMFWLVKILTGEFMRKIYVASWKLFTLTAEADRVLCQLVMFLTVFFHCMYKMKYSCYQESSVIHGWFVYWVFCLRNASLVKIG